MKIVSATANAIIKYVFTFRQNIWSRSCLLVFSNLNACWLSRSVLSTRSSIFSPRSSTFSMFSTMTFLTSSSCTLTLLRPSAFGSLL